MATDHGGTVLGAAEIAGQDAAAGKIVRYDCGWVGCDEIPMIVRRQLQEVEVGDVVEFLVRESSSKEDTPPFCRMLGHRILATDLQEDGALVIRVERAR
jgi:TusA-related sulfurtransferase